MTDNTVSPSVDRAVTEAMQAAGFSIQRTTPKAVVWRKDLADSFIHISFGGDRLFGDPDAKRWTVTRGKDNPLPDDKFGMTFDLTLVEALERAKAIEAASSSGPLPGTPMPTTKQTGNA